MIINGVNIPDPDVGDLRFLEKYEAANDRIAEKMQEITSKKIRRSDGVKMQCNAVFRFFDAVFGKGTSKKIFGDSVNLKTCIDAYEEAIYGVNALDKELGDYFRSKYPSNQKI